MAKNYPKPNAAAEVIDLDALIAEHQVAVPRRFKIFGKEHELVRPATPAGLLQILDLQRKTVQRRIANQGEAPELAGLTIAADRVAETVEILLLVLPSLQPHREDLRRLDFTTLQAINEEIGLAEMLDDAMKQIGATVAGEVSEEKEGGEDGEEEPETEEETLEGN